MSVLKKKTGIIVAFDMENVSIALELAEELNRAKGNFAIKIGRPLEMQIGKQVIKKIKEVSDLPLIYDGKIADIPFISKKIAEIAYKAGSDAVIIHSVMGSDVVKSVLELGMGDVIAVIEMTHAGATEYIQPVAENMAKVVSNLGVDGVVLPATRPDRIKKLSKLLEEMYIISPGIKAQGAEPGDAIVNGADYEVVGRAIYMAEDPKKAAENLYSQIINKIKQRR